MATIGLATFCECGVCVYVEGMNESERERETD